MVLMTVRPRRCSPRRGRGGGGTMVPSLRRVGAFLLLLLVSSLLSCSSASTTTATATATTTTDLRTGTGGIDENKKLRQRRRHRSLHSVDEVKDTRNNDYYSPIHQSRKTTTTTSTITSSAATNGSVLQPRVTVVEGLPSRCGIASISNPDGTPWCQGAPTYWITGHQHDHEIPRCFRNGSWEVSNTTELINSKDRHYCVTMDVNSDGLDDIICNVGAGSGRGMGYNELWMTNASGAITQLLNASSDNPYASPSGLQKYPSMRNRIAVTLRNASGVRKFVFMGTLGSPRDDGLPDQHRMFKNIYSSPTNFPYFVEVPGPWVTTTRNLFPATCAVSGDFTGDGVDDLIVCNPTSTSILAQQVAANESFVRVDLSNTKYATNLYRWSKVRLADITGDNRTDLVVIQGPPTKGGPMSIVVFQGIATPPYFDFDAPYYRRQMVRGTPDVEVLDVNQDGIADLYVIQVNNTKGAYCGPKVGVTFLPPNVVPPIDTAHDVLLLGTGPKSSSKFRAIYMRHAQPGCGSFAQRWDDQTMLLSQGSFENSGYQLLLEW